MSLLRFTIYSQVLLRLYSNKHILRVPNPSCPNPEQREKINLDFIFKVLHRP